MMTFTFADVSPVTNRLWIGGELATAHGLRTRQLNEMVERGLTHVIDTRAEHNDMDRVRLIDPSVSYHWQGIVDNGQRVPAVWFDQGVKVALDALDEPDTIVLSHCQAGINRGPSLGLAIMIAQGWDPIEALEEIVDARPQAKVAYAEDAVEWAHQRNLTAQKLDEDLRRLAQWREDRDGGQPYAPRHRRQRGHTA